MEAGLELEDAPGAARRPLLKLRVPSPVPAWLAKLLDAVPGARRLAASSGAPCVLYKLPAAAYPALDASLRAAATSAGPSGLGVSNAAAAGARVSFPCEMARAALSVRRQPCALE
jgi:hypothetical protein